MSEDQSVSLSMPHHCTNTELQLVLGQTWPPYTKGKLIVPMCPSHPLLHDLCAPCTPRVTLTSPAPGPVQPRYPSHPLLQDTYTPGTPHIPCASTSCNSEPPNACSSTPSTPVTSTSCLLPQSLTSAPIPLIQSGSALGNT